MKLNLGCGNDAQEGYVNTDIKQRPGTDVVWDLDVMPWPWADGEVEEIVAIDIFEHLDDMVAVMDECWRVMQVGGTMTVQVPIAGGTNHFDDPTHKRGFTMSSFAYWCPATQGPNPLLYGVGTWKLCHIEKRWANLIFILERLP